jgi:thioredoxin-like negative regulator of GroEL
MANRGLLILEEEDFELIEIQNPKNTSQGSNSTEGRGISGRNPTIHLTHTLSCKYSVVMFYTDSCDQCKIIKPILLRFVGTPETQICMVNVYSPDSANLIQLSQKTSTPLQHVPFIVFYIDGIPFKKFDGQYTYTDFQQFLTNVIFEAKKLKTTDTIHDIPPYTIGKPNSAKVCYLTYHKAY